MFPHLKGFNLQKWIDENRGDWGQRRVIWQDSDFIAFVTRGPNRRKDYHINPGDEIFYQLEGDGRSWWSESEGKKKSTALSGRAKIAVTNFMKRKCASTILGTR